MKNIFLSVVVVCALVVAGVGGTLATLSDTEESVGNKIEVASLDLKVNDKDDANAWGSTGVGAVLVQECILPDTPMQTLVKVENEGCADGYLYIVFKSLSCYNVVKAGQEGWIEDTNIPANVARLKPEPEMVAEYGGTIAQKTVPGIGRTGDNCCMGSHTYVWAGLDKNTPFWDNIVMGDTDDALSYVGMLPKCGGDHFINFVFNVPQENEGQYKMDYFNDLSPFNDWPANALQADGITFKILFILVDHQLSETEQAAIMADIWGLPYTPVVK
jgi:predicted ribosomally synthesized peptide with SipW-like signal peptide